MPTWPIDYSLISKTLVDAVMQATGLGPNSVILAQGETTMAPRGAKPYISIFITQVISLFGKDAFKNNPNASNTTTWTYYGPRSVSVDFNVYADDHQAAYNYASLLQACLSQEPTRLALKAGFLSVWNIGQATDVSILLNTAYEGRSLLQCEFGTMSSMDVDLSSIEQVTIDGTIATNTENLVTTTETVTLA